MARPFITIVASIPNKLETTTMGTMEYLLSYGQLGGLACGFLAILKIKATYVGGV
jgi:hypothetical protein